MKTGFFEDFTASACFWGLGEFEMATWQGVGVCAVGTETPTDEECWVGGGGDGGG